MKNLLTTIVLTFSVVFLSFFYRDYEGFLDTKTLFSNAKGFLFSEDSSKLITFSENQPPYYKKRSVTLGGVVITADIADSDVLRAQGLSGRAELAHGQGMLFIFDTLGTHGFWMKEMEFAIDLLWIDEHKVVIDYIKQFEPKTYPKVYYPNKVALYVLELPSGFIDAHNIKIGEQLEF